MWGFRPLGRSGFYCSPDVQTRGAAFATPKRSQYKMYGAVKVVSLSKCFFIHYNQVIQRFFRVVMCNAICFPVCLYFNPLNRPNRSSALLRAFTA